MIYQIKIEGGFAGIPKTIEGNLDLPASEKTLLIETLKKGLSDKTGENLRDGFTYHVLLKDGGEEYQHTYNDKNLPSILRILMQ